MNTKKKVLFATILFGIVAALSAEQAPKNVVPVQDFDLDKYLGKWYEIARFDFRHEKDMDNVTAEYYLNEDGTVKVINKGYDYVDGKWKESTGKAKFQGPTTVGALKVSFFGPFYSGYNVIAVDDFYTTALVAGKNYDYLWILSREPIISNETRNAYLIYADSLGYDTDKLVWVQHDYIN
jgi:apolipoprotein D and lipocalin family protein